MNRKPALFAAAALALAACLPANAQPKKTVEPPVPPTTTKIEDPGIIVPYLLAFVLIGAVVGVIAIPSKRGHQD